MRLSAIEMAVAPTKMPSSNCEFFELVYMLNRIISPTDKDTLLVSGALRPDFACYGRESFIYKSFYMYTNLTKAKV